MKKPTSTDVARLAGVSQTTVSMVLNNRGGTSISPQTRQKVLDAAAQLHYTAKARTVKKQLTVGLMVPTLANPYYPYLLQQVERDARARGIQVLIMDTARNPANEAPFYDYIKNGTVDGIVALYTPKTDIPPHLPIVLVGETSPDSSIDTLSVNSFRAGYLLTEHLLSRGHRAFAYISSPFDNITGARKLRLDGIRACLADSGLQASVTVLAERPECETDETTYEYECGYALTQQLLAQHTSVTAIIAVNDTTAAGCVNALQAAGVAIPQQMAVAGFDNLLIAQMLRPQLTSVDQMAGHAASVAIDLLVKKITLPHASPLPVTMEYQPHLIVRASTVEGA